MNCFTTPAAIRKAAILPLLLCAGLAFGASDGPVVDAANDAATNVGTEATSMAADLGNESQQLVVPSGTLLRVQLIERSHLRKGSPVEGRLLEPIYADNRLLIPSGAVLKGTIREVRPAPQHKRLNAKFQGDFTPLHEPVIQWTTLICGDGTQYPILGESTSGAGGTLYFRTAPPVHVSLVRRAWNSFVGSANSAVETAKAPGKGERLKRYFWSQMPYHPQYLEEGAQYEMALQEELHLTAGPLPAHMDLTHAEPLAGLVSVHSRLEGDLNSATAKPGDPVEAIVTEPVLDDHDQLIVPQNSILHGRVLSASAASRWGHNGSLRFAFDRLSWPSGFEQNVEATPKAVESNAGTHLTIDQEGGVARQNEHSIAAPLVMGLLSGSAISDDDGGIGTAAVASNGFAIAGHVLAIASGSRYVGGTIGAIGTGRSIYTHWLAHGKETHFGADTEIVLEMTPAHARRMSPAK
jgi:hypothetical protein